MESLRDQDYDVDSYDDDHDTSGIFTIMILFRLLRIMCLHVFLHKTI